MRSYGNGGGRGDEPDKGIEQPYLEVYVTCRLQWVAKVLKQIEEFQDGDKGLRAELAFVQKCNFGPKGVILRVDTDLTLVLVGRVEMWVKRSTGSDPVVGVVLSE